MISTGFFFTIFGSGEAQEWGIIKEQERQEEQQVPVIKPRPFMNSVTPV